MKNVKEVMEHLEDAGFNAKEREPMIKALEVAMENYAEKEDIQSLRNFIGWMFTIFSIVITLAIGIAGIMLT